MNCRHARATTYTRVPAGTLVNPIASLVLEYPFVLPPPQVYALPGLECLLQESGGGGGDGGAAGRRQPHGGTGGVAVLGSGRITTLTAACEARCLPRPRAFLIPSTPDPLVPVTAAAPIVRVDRAHTRGNPCTTTLRPR